MRRRCVLTLTLTPSAKAQVYWGSRYYYNPWTGDGAIGSPMKLRAWLDLTQIGKEEIKSTTHNLENIRKKEKQ